MTDYFGIELSEPNGLILDRMIELFYSKLTKHNGTTKSKGMDKINLENILEGNWSKYLLIYDYGKQSEMHICIRNKNGQMIAEISLDFQLMSAINDELNITNDNFIQVIRAETKVKMDFEVREKIVICAEEMCFVVGGQKRRPMMSDQGQISFSATAQRHDWNFEEQQTSPVHIRRLADQLHQTMLTTGTMIRDPQTSTPYRGQPRSNVPRFNPSRPPPNFSDPNTTTRRIHLYDTIDSTSEGSEELARQRRRPKKQKGEKPKEDPQDCEYSFVFKKAGASKQEKCIRTIIDNLHEMRKKKSEQASETLTKAGFEELAASIFKPLEELNAELTNESETSRTLEPTVEEDEIQVEPATNRVTRSKTKDPPKDQKDKEDELW